MDLIFRSLRKYADFTGRARRSEYWGFFVYLFGAAVVFGLIDDLVSGGRPGETALSLGLEFVVGLIILGLFLPLTALACRRLHDSNRTGWWMLIGFIPIVGGLVLLVFYCLDGTPGPNRFGQDPKGRNLTDASVFS